MSRLLFIYYLTLFCFLSIDIKAQQQNFVFQHLTKKDGLASDVTKFIFQDSKGFYWIGYYNGFQKFDGKNFTTTSFNNKYVVKYLMEQPLISPVEDKAGNVYIPNQNNIYVFHSSGSVDTTKIFDYLDDGTSDINDMCKDDLDNIWISTNIALYKYEKKRTSL